MLEPGPDLDLDLQTEYGVYSYQEIMSSRACPAKSGHDNDQIRTRPCGDPDVTLALLNLRGPFVHLTIKEPFVRNFFFPTFRLYSTVRKRRDMTKSLEIFSR